MHRQILGPLNPEFAATLSLKIRKIERLDFREMRRRLGI